jgi:hypothetical protein
MWVKSGKASLTAGLGACARHNDAPNGSANGSARKPDKWLLPMIKGA